MTIELTAYELDELRHKQRMAEVERQVSQWGDDWEDWTFERAASYREMRPPQNVTEPRFNTDDL